MKSPIGTLQEEISSLFEDSSLSLFFFFFRVFFFLYFLIKSTLPPIDPTTATPRRLRHFSLFALFTFLTFPFIWSSKKVNYLGVLRRRSETNRANEQKRVEKERHTLYSTRHVSTNKQANKKKNSSTCLCAVNWRVEICIKLVALIGGLNKIARLVVAFWIRHTLKTKQNKTAPCTFLSLSCDHN